MDTNRLGNVKTKLAILGFRGVGKSTASKMLSKMIKLPLYTMDTEIEKKEGRTISTIVEKMGWNYFRDLELDHLKSQASRKKVIIDCGGGILEGHDGNYSQEKAEVLKNNFYCIYLYLPDQTLLSRLENMQKKSSRPALQGDIGKILEKRKPWFEEIAHIKINTDGMSPRETAEHMMEQLERA